MAIKTESQNDLTFDEFKKTVLEDYTVAVTSRECSVLGRREVLTGKAKFGIFGDGKEVPQLAMARAFKKGDWRSGYYRDQTLMMALGNLTIENLFSGLYAHTSIEHDPMSAGRQMGGHFMSHTVREDNSWNNFVDQYNSSADVSCTAGQMPRLVGLAEASKLFRNLKINAGTLSNNGNEVAWGTIGNASTSEGMFFEAINAAGVLQIPMVTAIWDDDYGISVPNKYQTTKESISEILSGFQRTEEQAGFEIIKVKGWDYPALISVFEQAGNIARNEHVPVIIHVVELTQPQGHSTSGSHERYKSQARLEWEKEYDCNLQMRKWMIDNHIATDEELMELEKKTKRRVREGKTSAWQAFVNPIKQDKEQVLKILDSIISQSANASFIKPLKNELVAEKEPLKHDILTVARKTLRFVIKEDILAKAELQDWVTSYIKDNQPHFSSHLYNEGNNKATNIPCGKSKHVY